MPTPGTLKRIGAIITLAAAGFLNGCAVSGRLGRGGDSPDLLQASVTLGRTAERDNAVPNPKQLQATFEPLGRAAPQPPSLPVLQNEVAQDRNTLGALEQNIDTLAESLIPPLTDLERELDTFNAPEAKQQVRALLRTGTFREFIARARALSPESKTLVLFGLLACLIILIRSRRARATRREEAARLLAAQKQAETLQLHVNAALATTMQQARHMVEETRAHFAAMNQAFADKLGQTLAESRAREGMFEEALHDISALLALAHPKDEAQTQRLVQAIVARILKARQRI